VINTWPAPTCAGLFFFTYSFTCWQGKSSSFLWALFRLWL